MNWRREGIRQQVLWLVLPLFLLVNLMAGSAWAASIQVNVNAVDEDGNPTGPVSGFRYLLEEDPTFKHNPRRSCETFPDECLSFGFHKSHWPVAKHSGGADKGKGVAGEITGASGTISGVKKNTDYYLSILPFDAPAGGASLGGMPVRTTGGTVTANVTVNQQPIPTAQITVFVFPDDRVINNAPDLPAEAPGTRADFDPTRFSIILEEAGGQYGDSGAQVLQDAFGNNLGTLRPNADGVLTIKNLVPGKYGIFVVPPEGEGWQQTSTIEGKKVIDAWVKADEPPFFVEFGPPGPHVFVGFVKPMNKLTAYRKALAQSGVTFSTAAISGEVVNLRMSRPPSTAFYNGQPIPSCWVGLNTVVAGAGEGLYAAPCSDLNGDGSDSEFRIPTVPTGVYNLAVWDANLDVVFAQYGIEVLADGSCATPNGSCDLNEVPVFNWFAKVDASVFFDSNEDGVWDDGEPPLGADMSAVNLRWRDGRIYQSFPIDGEGAAPFDEVFPFFHWLVGEVDFATLKATGASFTADAGGPVPYGEVLNPAYGTDTETGVVLTEGFQAFLGQTIRMEFGKAAYNYATGENGGISGMIYYATTRAEPDPEYAAAELWEPGVPNVQINLYKDENNDKIIDDKDGSGGVTLADVDNPPFGWRDCTGDVKCKAGPEDVNNTGSNRTFDFGDAIEVTWTDSWDDNLPTGCDLANNIPAVADDRCFDGLRNFNQAKPAVFDGGFAFGPDPTAPLPSGWYIVEAATPPGLVLLKEEDNNVAFGDEFIPDPLLLPPLCVGEPHEIPKLLSMLSHEDGSPLPGIDPDDPANWSPYYEEDVNGVSLGVTRELCDRKQVRLSTGKNAGVEFFVFSQVPKAAHVTGGILNDVANEFDPAAPTFGEKYAPPNLPVAFYDWAGNEVNRVYADQFGKFNALLPSTFTMNVPMPSGISPNMLTACMNDSGPAGGTTVDPYHNPQYSQFCYTFQYIPAATTYLDTPVLPVAAFAGPGKQLDCEEPTKTPLVKYATVVRGGNQIGPYGLTEGAGDLLEIHAVGNMRVPHPNRESGKQNRNYNFGTGQGTVQLVDRSGVPFEVPIVSWTKNLIEVRLRDLRPDTSTEDLEEGNYQLVVTRADNGRSSPMGVTVTVREEDGNVHRVPGDFPTIQAAIDFASPGDYVLVAPGTYNEMLVMTKPIRLQGWGAFATVVNARPVPFQKVQDWRDKVNTLFCGNIDCGTLAPDTVQGDAFDLVPGQQFIPGVLEPTLFFDSETAALTIAAKNPQTTAGGDARLFRNVERNRGRYLKFGGARVDGLSFTSASHGGGIFVNGYAEYLEVSNNRVMGNQGNRGGGVRFGHPGLFFEANDGLHHADAGNNYVTAHHNQVAMNGNFQGAGGGFSLYSGSHGYKLEDNLVCGNFSQGHGGGVGHLGLSDAGPNYKFVRNTFDQNRTPALLGNRIVFNQSFNQGLNRDGGGVYIGGDDPIGDEVLTPGSGNVSLADNLIQGNQAGAGDGGGVALAAVNGQEVAASLTDDTGWYGVDLSNNLIVNNVAGYRAGGLSLKDAAKVQVLHDTIANNDSTATVGDAFTVSNNLSDPQVAGIAAFANSLNLGQLLNLSGDVRYTQGYSNPVIHNSIVWHNRTHRFETNATFNPSLPVSETNWPHKLTWLGDLTTHNGYDDFAVIGAAGQLDPHASLLSADIDSQDAGPYDGDNSRTGNARFRKAYVNESPFSTIAIPEAKTSLAVGVAADEGGNFIDVRYSPLTMAAGNYHIRGNSPARNAGDGAMSLGTDYDGDVRPLELLPDMGADEFVP